VTAQRDEVAGWQTRALQSKQKRELAMKQTRLAERKKEADDAAAEVAVLEAEMAKRKGK
jgi:hypothetical protein